MRSLERLDAFRLARQLAVDAYALTRIPPLARHPILADQIGRAAVSIPANIAEAFALGTTRQLVRGMRIAFGSAVELGTLLWIARRSEALPASDPVRRIVEDSDRVTSMLVGLLKRYGARVGE
jgi:four helix bundle protein